MSRFYGDIEYKCTNCENRSSVRIDECDENCVVVAERQMGEELICQYTYATSCDSCGKDIEIVLVVSEYPMTAINHVQDHSSGALAEFHSAPGFEPGFDFFEEELQWVIATSEHAKLLQENLDNASEMLNVRVIPRATHSHLVMLQGFVVAAIEGYLASTFIHTVTNSLELIRKLVETDPEFSKRKFSLNQIFYTQEQLPETIGEYLQELVFHNLKKVKPMYRQVLGLDFGDIGWLFDAVKLRHDCVHRAGYDKEGKPVLITKDSLELLIQQARDLAELIEKTIIALRRLRGFDDNIPF